MIYIYFWKARFLFFSNSFQTDMHSHNMVQIIIGINEAFTISSNFSGIHNDIKTQAVLIDANCSHQLNGGDGWQASMLIDPQTILAQTLRNCFLKKQPIQTLDNDIFKLFEDELMHFTKGKLSCSIATQLHEKLERYLSQYCATLHHNLDMKETPTDSRIETILEQFSDIPERKTSIKKLATLVHLSESRLSHLFKHQTGIPIRRYLLWLRLRDAMNAILAGNDFTTAAHLVGFSDSAHLARIFRRMFGKTLSDLFKNPKNSKFVQVISCDNE